jgi:hypothetical protein
MQNQKLKCQGLLILIHINFIFNLDRKINGKDREIQKHTCKTFINIHAFEYNYSI